jgi:hypothetical protein
MAGTDNVYEMLKRCGRNRERYELIRPAHYQEKIDKKNDRKLLENQQ